MASSDFNVHDDSNWMATGTTVDLSSYTSASNAYECPSDGYIVLMNPHGQAFTRAADSTTYLVFSGIPDQTGNSTTYTSYFVRKGMKLYASNVPTGGGVYFRSLKRY